VIEAVADDPAFGSIVIAITLPSAEAADRKMPPIVDALQALGGRKPVVFAMLGEDCPIPEGHIEAVRATGVPFFRSPERAFRALAQLTRAGGIELAPADDLKLKTGPELPSGTIPEYRAKALLAEFGVPIANGRLATTLEAAVQIAGEIGWPVVIKAQSADLSHKSDVGGVAIGIADEAALRIAWDAMNGKIAQARPGLELDGILVEPMAAGGLELIVGARNDGEWGPVILVGMGGVMAEVLRDAALIPAIAPRAAMKDALLSLSGAALFGGYRGSEAVDLEAALDVVEALARVVRCHPEIAEVDLNPVVLHTKGKGASVLDALIVIR
jgi:acyl-CoA synthetase (NDP forming)